MSFTRRVADLLEKLTGARIFGYLPPGIDVFVDLHRLVPHLTLDTVVDVGANIGQSAIRFMAANPDAAIYCFEPVQASFQRLRDTIGQRENVHCLRLALGAEQKEVYIAASGHSVFNAVMPDMPDRTLLEGTHASVERVLATTLDEVCRDQRLLSINYLKIDTEGSDLDVLRGASNLLATESIDVIEVEAGMNPENALHVPFETLKSYLERRGYRLFGLYEQTNEWPTMSPQLRRCNAVFLAGKHIRRCEAVPSGN